MVEHSCVVVYEVAVGFMAKCSCGYKSRYYDSTSPAHAAITRHRKKENAGG